MPLTDGWRTHCTKAVTNLKPHVNKDFDMITCSGISGQCVGFYVAHVLKVPLLLVRKEVSKTGAYRTQKGNEYGVQRILVNGFEIVNWAEAHGWKNPRVCFLDDWIAGGGTRKETGMEIHREGGDMVFQYLYAGTPSRTGPQKGLIPPTVHDSFGPVFDLKKYHAS